jgi:hypothetical protein
MLDNIDGAQMVMVDPRESEYVICWFGTAQIHLFDSELNELEVKTIGGGINSGYDARCHAEDWFDEWYDAEYEDEDDGYDDE